MDNVGMIGTGPWIKFLWKGHIANWPWRTSLQRRLARNLALGDYKMTYLRKEYTGFAENIKLPTHNLYPAGESLQGSGKEREENEEGIIDIPFEDEKVFSLWFQGVENAPEIVKKCLGSLRREFGDRVHILSEETIPDYITLPDFITEKWKKGQIVPPNYSDLVRIELLCEHGGYWFDATDFVTDTVPAFIRHTPFFMYLTSDVFLPQMFVTTCFMRGKKGDPLMLMWRELVWEYWRREDVAVDYYLVHLLLKLLVSVNHEARVLFDAMPKVKMDPTHVLWHEIGDRPYDEKQVAEMLKGTFFQKCSYKPQRHGVNEIIPGSNADFIVNKYRQ